MTDRYASAAGNDANAGTQASPYKTIGQLIAAMAAGDRGFLRGGDTFTQTLTIGSGGVPGGSAANPSVIDKYGTGRPIIDRSAASGVDCIANAGSNVKFVQIRGLDLRPAAPGAGSSRGIFVSGPSSNSDWLFEDIVINTHAGSTVRSTQVVNCAGGSDITFRGVVGAKSANGNFYIIGQAATKATRIVCEDSQFSDCTGNQNWVMHSGGPSNDQGTGGGHRVSRMVGFNAAEQNFGISEPTSGDATVEFCHGHDARNNASNNQCAGKTIYRYNLFESPENQNWWCSSDLNLSLSCNNFKGGSFGIGIQRAVEFENTGYGDIYITHNIIDARSHGINFQSDTSDAMFKTGAKVYVQNNLFDIGSTGDYAQFDGGVQPGSTKIGSWNGNYYYGSTNATAWGGLNFATWKAAPRNYDAVSASGINPLFAAASTNNYTPTAPAYKNAGIATLTDPKWQGHPRAVDGAPEHHPRSHPRRVRLHAERRRRVAATTAPARPRRRYRSGWWRRRAAAIPVHRRRAR